MQFDHLLTLLTCHSIEDFPVHLQGSEAASVLANWTATWHPELIANCGKTPTWLRWNDLPNLSGPALVLIPKHIPFETTDLPTPNSVTILQGIESRCDIWEKLGLTNGSTGNLENPLASGPEDFAALGFAFLQTQLMTRRLRFTWELDTTAFDALVVEAARAFVDGHLDRSRQKLRLVFDQLLAERNKAYPVDGQILDLVLSAPKLWKEHCWKVPKLNLLVSVEELKKLKEQNPSDWEQLRERVEQASLQVITGPRRELPEILISSRSAVHELVAGRRIAQNLLGFEPATYGKLTGGLHPGLPQWLNSLGYRAALHLAFDDLRLPPASGNTISWRGISDESIDAIAGTVIDATRADDFIDWSMNIGQQLDSAHQATLVIAHHPGQIGEACADVIRTARFNSLLGKFVTADELFDSLYHPGYGERFDYDDYRAGWLNRWEREGRVNLLSSSIDYWQSFHRWLSLRQLNATLSFLSDQSLTIDQELEPLLEVINELIEPPRSNQTNVRQQALDKLRTGFERIESELINVATKILNPDGKTDKGVALLNTSFAERRVLWNFSKPNSFDCGDPVVVAATRSECLSAVVDLPGNGFSVVAKKQRSAVSSQPSPVIDNVLRNDYFEVEIDRLSGGIKSIRKHGSRTKLASQQLAILLNPAVAEQSENAREGYAQMLADSVEFDSPNPLVGRSIATGTLVDGETVWGRFRQTVQVMRACRTFDVHVEIDLVKPLTGAPWEQYCCSRLAWNDDALERYRGMHETHQPLRLEKFIAPTYVHIDNGYLPVTLFSRGLLFHRQSRLRILDTLLSIRGETSKSFSFSIGIGIDNPTAMARQLAQPHWTMETALGNNQSQRFFHLSHRNIAVLDAFPFDDGGGRVNGVVLWLRETMGKRGELVIHAPLPLKGVKRLDLAGRPLEGLAVHDDQVHVEYHEFKLFVVQLFW